MSLLKQLKKSLRSEKSALSDESNAVTRLPLNADDETLSRIKNPFEILKGECIEEASANAKKVPKRKYHLDPAAKSSIKSFQRESSRFVDTMPEDAFWRKTLQIDFTRKMRSDVWYHRFVLGQDEQHDAQSVTRLLARKFEERTFTDLMHVHVQKSSYAEELVKRLDLTQEALWGMERDLMEKWIAYLGEIGYYNPEETPHEEMLQKPFQSDVQQYLFEEFNRYKDVWFSHRTEAFEQHLMEAYTLHLLNHLLKTKRYEWYNDEKRKHVSRLRNNSQYEVKDLGYVRTKILVLVPFRHQCFQIVTLLTYLMPKVLNVRKEEAFELTFGDADAQSAFKSYEYKKRFPGNLDDNFVLGVSLNQGQLSLMAPLEESDIIMATPLGLYSEMSEEQLKTQLSSVELCIVDRLNTIQMQNWEFLCNVFDNMNQPQSTISEKLQVSRVKDYFLHGRSQQFRQTIFVSEDISLDAKALFEGPTLTNTMGKLKVHIFQDGVVEDEQVPLIFEKFKTKSIVKADDARFKFFTDKVMPRFFNEEFARILVVVPSFFDMVRLKKYMEDNRESFACISDDVDKPSKILEKVTKEDLTYTLITERQWYFHETKSSLFTHNYFIFYSLPEHQQMFKKFIQRADATHKKNEKCQVLSLFCKYDLLNLEKAVGEEDARRFVKSKERVFEL